MNRNPCTGWKDGDLASCLRSDGSIELGTVRVRKALHGGRYYVKVQVGPDRWEWPEGWILGQGPHAGECVACQQPFRSEAPADFCPACLRKDRQNVSDPRAQETRSIGGTLRGAKTPMQLRKVSREEQARQEREFAEQRQRDQEASPF